MINIVEEIEPGYSSCYRCVANFYTIILNESNLSILISPQRIKIQFDKTPEISWNDFKITLPKSNKQPYEVYSNIELQPMGLSFFNGAYKGFKAQGVFYADISKVKDSYKSEENLNHVKFQFYLSQLYAKKLEQKINSVKLKIKDKDKIRKMVNEFTNKLNKVQELYANETDFGRNVKAQRTWANKLILEFNQYDIKTNSSTDKK